MRILILTFALLFAVTSSNAFDFYANYMLIETLEEDSWNTSVECDSCNIQIALHPKAIVIGLPEQTLIYRILSDGVTSDNQAIFNCKDGIINYQITSDSIEVLRVDAPDKRFTFIKK